jgi:hypothetical protein
MAHTSTPTRAALAASKLPASASSASRALPLPGGTVVTVTVTDKVSSGSAKVGDTFGVTTTDDVIIDGYVAIQKGAGGQGEVLAVDPAGSHGHAGSLGVKLDWVYAVDGEKVRLNCQRKTAEGENKSGVSSTMTILSWAVLGPVGLFTHNFVKGHDMVLDQTHPLTAFVDDTVHVSSATPANNNATGFAH